MATRAERARSPWRLALLSAGLALAAGLVQHLALLPPAWIERLYARGLFPPLRDALVFVAGLVPLSLAELVLVPLVVLVLVALARGLAHVVRGRRTARAVLATGLRRALLGGGALYLAFLLLWGLNHGREPYARSAGLELRPSAVAELRAATEEQLARVTELRAQLAQDEQGVFRSRLDRAALAAALAEAWSDAARAEPLLAGPSPLVRHALLSPLLTAFGVAGIYSPFTAEAHVNAALPAAQLGFAACHELAHARGFAREDEANFLAWHVGARAREPELAYSATLGALRHLLAALAAADVAAWIEVRARVTPEVRRDLAAIDAFWNPRTRVARTVRHVSERVNDTYLKSQGQALGTRSYGRMVDLLLATRRAR